MTVFFCENWQQKISEIEKEFALSLVNNLSLVLKLKRY